jgi:hypothetical protein
MRRKMRPGARVVTLTVRSHPHYLCTARVQFVLSVSNFPPKKNVLRTEFIGYGVILNFRHPLDLILDESSDNAICIGPEQLALAACGC